jgi:hypothetical protein
VRRNHVGQEPPQHYAYNYPENRPREPVRDVGSSTAAETQFQDLWNNNRRRDEFNVINRHDGGRRMISKDRLKTRLKEDMAPLMERDPNNEGAEREQYRDTGIFYSTLEVERLRASGRMAHMILRVALDAANEADNDFESNFVLRQLAVARRPYTFVPGFINERIITHVPPEEYLHDIIEYTSNQGRTTRYLDAFGRTVHESETYDTRAERVHYTANDTAQDPLRVPGLVAYRRLRPFRRYLRAYRWYLDSETYQWNRYFRRDEEDEDPPDRSNYTYTTRYVAREDWQAFQRRQPQQQQQQQQQQQGNRGGQKGRNQRGDGQHDEESESSSLESSDSADESDDDSDGDGQAHHNRDRGDRRSRDRIEWRISHC